MKHLALSCYFLVAGAVALAQTKPSTAVNKQSQQQQQYQADSADNIFSTGTVTKYEPGKLLAIRMKNQIRTHTYGLINGNEPVVIYGNLSNGERVRVMQTEDSDGEMTVSVEPNNTAGNV